MWALHVGARIVFIGETIFDLGRGRPFGGALSLTSSAAKNAFTTTLSQIRAYAAAGRARRLPIELPGSSGSRDPRSYER
jgi:hypothetical protein